LIALSVLRCEVGLVLCARSAYKTGAPFRQQRAGHHVREQAEGGCAKKEEAEYLPTGRCCFLACGLTHIPQ
jgi:hypothetical protein